MAEPSLEGQHAMRSCPPGLTGSARPNIRLAVAFDLKVFFTVVDKTRVRVTSADVMAFIGV